MKILLYGGAQLGYFFELKKNFLSSQLDRGNKMIEYGILILKNYLKIIELIQSQL